ncbi:hypothetical protein [Cronobacter malonaticus]|uniref:hypothetical protein n=1 Tax=Cronobacter malonaticus TaxID=413503 RepID=UPI000CFB8574|nr:hypothetical protein [Cronobacter malonaticus]
MSEISKHRDPAAFRVDPAEGPSWLTFRCEEDLRESGLITDGDKVVALIELLALRERAEPVYQLWSSGINQWVECDKGRYEAHAHVPAQRRVLYTAPPAPVVADETFDEWSRRCEIQLTLCRPEFREVAEITWNACRAAMLNGGK